MTTMTQLSDYAQTELAAYATDLATGIASNTTNYNAPGVGMADAQATAFDAAWAVIQQSAPNLNGFSAVLLQNRSTGEKVLAIAGTDPSSPADLLTDLSIVLGSSVINLGQYAALEAFYTQLLSDPAHPLGANEAITVTGHSLGGFLAQAFTARHPAVVSTAYTYNGLGLGSTDQLIGYLGITDSAGAAAKITNVHAVDGISATSWIGTRLGTTHEVRIEGSTNPVANHSVVALGDALAIYATYAKLQPTITTAQASALFVASGNAYDQLVITDAGNDLIVTSGWSDNPTRSDADTVSAGTGSDMIFTGLGCDIIEGREGDDFIMSAGLAMLASSQSEDPANQTPADANWVRAGMGNDEPLNAIYVIATNDHITWARGLFDCKNGRIKANSRYIRWGLAHSNAKAANARPMWLVGHKWLGSQFWQAANSTNRRVAA